jgi:hypothetical protein
MTSNEEGATMETEPLRFDCPRCGATTSAAYWGPCERCREDLASTMVGEARAVEVGAFEPVMHVVPNQVATRD